MRLLWLATGFSAILGAGCSMFAPIPEQHPDRLPASERDFSQSLARFSYGLLLEQEQGDMAGAVESFRVAARLAPTNALPSDLVVGRLWGQGRYEEALQELQKLCRRIPTVERYVTLASIAEAQGDYALAADSFARAAALSGDKPLEWKLEQIRVLIKGEMDKKALKIIKGELRKTDKDLGASIPLLWGHNLYNLPENKERSRPFFKLSLKLAKNDHQKSAAHEALAFVAIEAANTNRALKEISRSMAALPSNNKLLATWMRFHLVSHGMSVTNDWQAQALKKRPDTTVLMALAHMAALRGDYRTANHEYSRARRILQRRDTKLEVGFYSLNSFYAEQSGQLGSAEAILRESLETHPESAPLQNHLAYFLATHNRLIDEALALVEKALKSDPGNGAYRDTLGWVFYRQGRYHDAQRELLLALEDLGEEPEVMDHLGDVSLALGKLDEALSYWRGSLEKQPGNSEIKDKIERHQVEIQ